MTNNTSPTDHLIVALDMPHADQARTLIKDLGDTVTFYKIGLELVFAGGLELAQDLIADGKKVFLDMKFLDIGNTVEKAVANASQLGVDFLTIHGHDTKTLEAAVAGRGSHKTKLFAVTVLTSLTKDDLEQQGTSETPEDLVLRRARLADKSGFDGCIASGLEANRIRQETRSDFLIVTPGIRLAGGATDDQARVMTPERAIAAGANHLVVGRPITKADTPRDAAQSFQDQIAAALNT